MVKLKTEEQTSTLINNIVISSLYIIYVIFVSCCASILELLHSAYGSITMSWVLVTFFYCHQLIVCSTMPQLCMYVFFEITHNNIYLLLYSVPLKPTETCNLLYIRVKTCEIEESQTGRQFQPLEFNSISRSLFHSHSYCSPCSTILLFSSIKFDIPPVSPTKTPERKLKSLEIRRD